MQLQKQPTRKERKAPPKKETKDLSVPTMYAMHTDSTTITKN